MRQIWLSAAALALFLTACSVQQDEVTKQDFITRADAICRDLEPEGDRIDRTNPEP